MTINQKWSLEKAFAEAVEHYQIEGGIAKKYAYNNAVADFYADAPLIAAKLGIEKAGEIVEWTKSQKGDLWK